MQTFLSPITRLATVAIMAVVAASAFAQGPDGQGFGGQGGPPQGGMMGGPGGMRGGPQSLDRLPSLANLALRPEVATELGLTEDQVSGIQAIAQSMRPQRGRGGQGGQGGARNQNDGGQRPDPAAREKLEAAADAKILAGLSNAQARRLAEIQIQSMGLTAAFVPSVQTKLGLSADQKTALKALLPARRGPGEGGQGGQDGPPPDGGMGGGPGGQGGPPDGQGGMGGPGGQGGPGQGGPGQGGPGMGGGNEAQRKVMETKIAAILTSDQKATLKALGGKTIKLSPERGRGGPGGGMGGPGGQGGPGQGGQGGPPPDGGR